MLERQNSNIAVAVATNDTPAEYRCPKHPDTLLWNVLKGGAGFCKRCGYYVQAAGIAMPQLDPELAARREAALAAARKTKSKAKAKTRRTSKRARSADQVQSAVPALTA